MLHRIPAGPRGRKPGVVGGGGACAPRMAGGSGGGGGGGGVSRRGRTAARLSAHLHVDMQGKQPWKTSHLTRRRRHEQASRRPTGTLEHWNREKVTSICPYVHVHGTGQTPSPYHNGAGQEPREPGATATFEHGRTGSTAGGGGKGEKFKKTTWRK